MAGAQVPGSLGPYALEALPLAFFAQGWQCCVLRSPPPDAVLPLVGTLARCRDRSAVCDSVPGRASRGPSSTAYEARLGGGNRGSYPPRGLGPQYVPLGGRAPSDGGIPPPSLAGGPVGPPPPPAALRTAGGGDCREELEPPDPPRQPPPLVPPPPPPRPPPDPGKWVEPSLRSTPVAAPGLRMGGGDQPDRPCAAGVRLCPRPPRRNPYTPLQVPGTPASGGSHGEAAGHTPGSPSTAGALWSGGRSPASTDAHGSRAAGAGSFNGEGRGSCRRGRCGWGRWSGQSRCPGWSASGAQAGAPAKRRRIGPKIAQETGPPAPSLADPARLAARSGGLVRPPL